ncbi:MAG: rhodanese-like domain-containing protein [Acidimicrobiia bacterium]|nr:rhodanese-like domain-containing protein [Acidimicrobiia bacterium]
MRQYIVFVVLGLVVASCGSATAELDVANAPAVNVLAATEVDELLAAPPTGLVVLDVRTPEEVAAGHLPDQRNIDFYDADFAAQLDGLNKDVPYLVYCRSGNRSGTAVQQMRELGFSTIYELEGGVLAWEQAGLTLER